MAHPYFQGPHPRAFAHRGGARAYPENTLEAFAEAISLGYRYIETDVHLTRDGRFAVFHDDRLERTTDGAGVVRAHTLRELAHLDAGYRFTPDGEQFPWRGRGARIPALEDALALHPEARFNVELKGDDPSVAGPMWALIERLGVHDRMLVAAANHRVGDAFRRLARGAVPTSPGYDGILRFWLAVRSGIARLPRKMPLGGLPFEALQVPRTHGALRVVDSAFVRAAHARGIEVHVWTIDDPQEMHALLDLGVDGIMTDLPAVLAEVMARHPRGRALARSPSPQRSTPAP